MQRLKQAVQHRTWSTTGWGSQAWTRGRQPGQPDLVSSASRPQKHGGKSHPTKALFRRMSSYVVGQNLISVECSPGPSPAPLRASQSFSYQRVKKVKDP